MIPKDNIEDKQVNLNLEENEKENVPVTQEKIKREEQIPKNEETTSDIQNNFDDVKEENKSEIKAKNDNEEEIKKLEKIIQRERKNISEQQQNEKGDENKQENNDDFQYPERKRGRYVNNNKQALNPLKKVIYAQIILDLIKGANDETKDDKTTNDETKDDKTTDNKNEEIPKIEKIEEEIEKRSYSVIQKGPSIKEEEKNKSFDVISVQEQNLNAKLDGNEKENEKDYKENFLEGIPYDDYLSELTSQKKKESDIERESFCEGFFIASFPQKEGQVIENSQSFPAPCGHSECSSLPAMKPEIIFRYPLKDTKSLELNNLAATICFPTGIKVCYSEDAPPLITDYVTPITNQKGERYYMTTFHYYHKFMNDLYTKLYEMHPLKHHLMKFGDSYLDLNDEEMDETITNKIQESLEKSQVLGFRDCVYVPYCICLISKYPYVVEMKKCLESIFTMIINNSMKNNKLDLNNLIMYLIHSVPIPERNTKVKCFIPYCNRGIELVCPKVQDISIMGTNISNILKIFGIDRIVTIFRLMLFEKKILFIDDDYTRLSLVTDSFITLLYPFEWVHTYIPIMSDQMIKYLETFLPFINGINSSLMNLVTDVFKNNDNEESEEVFLIYNKLDKFKLGCSLTTNHIKKYKYLHDNVPALPSSIEKELRNKLKKSKEELDNINKNSKDKQKDLSELDFKIRNIFIDLFVQMFYDYKKYMTFLEDDVVFNKTLFLEKITNNNDKHFYDEFIDTQLFQMFTQNIVKDELNYFATKAKNYDQNKKLTSTKNLPIKLNKEDKEYIIKPDYLQINGENSKLIEEQMKTKYQITQSENNGEKNDFSSRIVSDIDKIKDENYINHNCYIYTLPETLELKSSKSCEITTKIDETNTEKKKEINIGSNIQKKLEMLNLKPAKTFAKKGSDLTEKDIENIKETIKDFTIKIFKSEKIEEEEINDKSDKNDKKGLQKSILNNLNTSIGREFFCNILLKNSTNKILLKEESFKSLGFIIYHTLLSALNIDESDKLMEQLVILVRSMKYFCQEKKGTITIWDSYKSKIHEYSKISQPNFWNKWYELEKKKETELNDELKEKIILSIYRHMKSLELDVIFIKQVTYGICEQEFGKDSEQYKNTAALILEKIRKNKNNPKKKK